MRLVWCFFFFHLCRVTELKNHSNHFFCALTKIPMGWLCLFYLRALGSCPGGILFRQRLLCAFILPLVRRLLRLSWLRVLQLLPELLRLRLGRLLSALVAPSLLRRGLWRGGGALVGRWTRLAWPRMARASLTRSFSSDR